MAPLVFSRVFIFCPWTPLGLPSPETWFVPLSKFLSVCLSGMETHVIAVFNDLSLQNAFEPQLVMQLIARSVRLFVCL